MASTGAVSSSDVVKVPIPLSVGGGFENPSASISAADGSTYGPVPSGPPYICRYFNASGHWNKSRSYSLAVMRWMWRL